MASGAGSRHNAGGPKAVEALQSWLFRPVCASPSVTTILFDSCLFAVRIPAQDGARPT